MRDFAEVFDYYQAAVYDRAVLAGSIGAVLRSTGSVCVLDCACGTGLPGIDLRAMGFDVECCDADALMLGQFRRNAVARGVDDKASQLSWDGLAALDLAYDYVMCRGNSLAYADSWEAGCPAASLGAIERHVQAIAAVVAPGGFLHVDAPRAVGMSAVSHPEVVFRGERVRVSERVCVSGGRRRWEQRVVIGAEPHEFVRYSAGLTGSALRDILSRSGLSDVRDLDLPGERASYHVLLARKPGL